MMTMDRASAAAKVTRLSLRYECFTSGLVMTISPMKHKAFTITVVMRYGIAMAMCSETISIVKSSPPEVNGDDTIANTAKTVK